MLIVLSTIVLSLAFRVHCEPEPGRRTRPEKQHYTAATPSFHFIVALESEYLTNDRSFWNLDDVLRDPFYYIKDDEYFNGDSTSKAQSFGHNYTINPIFIELPKNGR